MSPHKLLRIPTIPYESLHAAAGEMIEQSLAELFEHGWLVEEQRLSLADAGREHLRRRMRATHRLKPVPKAQREEI